VSHITCAAYRTEDALILTVSRLRCADPCRTGLPVGVGSGARVRPRARVAQAKRGDGGQAVADRRTFCATTGAGYVRHSAGYVKSYTIEQKLRLVVRGVQPLNFLTILRNTVDLILDRFQGLQVIREVPCNCHMKRHAANWCPRLFSYGELVAYDEAGKREIFCMEGKTDVSVRELLYGLHESTQEAVLADMRQTQHIILDEQRHDHEQQREQLQQLDVLIQMQRQQSELIARGFARQWNLEMHRLEAECPNTFYLMPGSRGVNVQTWLRSATSQEFHLYLMCQHPTGPHGVGDGYRVRKDKEWWITVSPWLRELVTFLKFAVPMVAAIDEAINEEAFRQHLKGQADLLEEIVALPEAMAKENFGNAEIEDAMGRVQQSTGTALRALHAFLVEVDKNENWGGLESRLTPDGTILWLCEKHRQPYEEKVLILGN